MRSPPESATTEGPPTTSPTTPDPRLANHPTDDSPTNPQLGV